MNVTRLQDLSDNEFVTLVQMHTAHLSTLVHALEEHKMIGGYLKDEAVRRQREAAAIPHRVDAALRAIKDKTP
jgi:hypothetical protein